MKKIVFSLFLICFSLPVVALQFNYSAVLRNIFGNSAYNRGNMEKATRKYQKNSVDRPSEGVLHFNLGDALYKTDKMEEAYKEYQMAINDPKFKMKDKSYHNMGNINFKNGDYQQALTNFRKSMTLNPSNIDSRKNYELTLKKIKEEDQKKNQKNQNDQNKDQDKKDQKKQDKQQDSQAMQDAMNMMNNVVEKEKEDMKKKKQNGSTLMQGKYW